MGRNCEERLASPGKIFPSLAGTAEEVNWCDLSTWCVSVWTVTGAGPFQSNVSTQHLANVDFLQRVLPNLRARYGPAVASGNDCDVLLFAPGRRYQTVFGHLKIALTLDAGQARRCPTYCKQEDKTAYHE